MKVVKIEVVPLGQGNVVSGSLFIQQRRGEGWVQLEERPYMSDQGAIAISLTDDQRLVIGGGVSHRVEVDRTQNVATRQAIPGRLRPAVTTKQGAADDESPQGDVVERAMSTFEQDALRERQAAAATVAREKLKSGLPPYNGEAKQSSSKVVLRPGIIDDDVVAQQEVVGVERVAQALVPPPETPIEPAPEAPKIEPAKVVRPDLPSWAQPK